MSLDKLPNVFKQGWAFSQTMAKFALSGFSTANESTRFERLSICEVCPRRSGRRCLECGCFIDAKSHIQAAECPKKYWVHEKILATLRQCVQDHVRFTREKMYAALGEDVPPTSDKAENDVDDWDKSKILVGVGALTREQLETRLESCDTCPAREGTYCGSRGAPIVALLHFRQPCPEGKWPELPIIDEGRNGYQVDDHGNITGKREMPNPCGNCKYRRVSVVWRDPPIVRPYCTLFGRKVKWSECCDCSEREE